MEERRKRWKEHCTRLDTLMKQSPLCGACITTCIALANTLARIAWSVLVHGQNFEARKTNEAAAQPA